MVLYRSSDPEMFLGKGVLKLHSNLFCNFIEIRLHHGWFTVNLKYISRAPFPRNTSGWLLLSIATPVIDIPAEMLKSTSDVHVSLLTKIINSCLRNGCFHMNWKLQKLAQCLRKTTKKTIGLSLFCLMCQRSLKGYI